MVRASPHKPKGLRFNSWSRHMCRLWVWSLVGACETKLIYVSLSHRCFSLSLLLSLKSISISLGEDIKKMKKRELYLSDKFFIYCLIRFSSSISKKPYSWWHVTCSPFRFLWLVCGFPDTWNKVTVKSPIQEWRDLEAKDRWLAGRKRKEICFR